MYLNIRKKINIFDNYMLFMIKKNAQNKYLDKLIPIITSMGNLGIVWVGMSIALSFDKPYRIIENIVLLTLIISTIIGEGIVKHIVRRVRPCYDESGIKLLIGKPITYSFPSGHTLSSFAVAKILSAYFSD